MVIIFIISPKASAYPDMSTLGAYAGFVRDSATYGKGSRCHIFLELELERVTVDFVFACLVFVLRKMRSMFFFFPFSFCSRLMCACLPLMVAGHDLRGNDKYKMKA